MRENISFLSHDLRLAGHLYLPESPSGKPLAGVVVSHPFGGVKEQAAGLYAQELAKNGFAALAFDASYQGDSEGTPRFLEDPFIRAEDLRSAVSFLQSRPEVDAERIGAFGICASGGYVPYAASTDLRIKAVATASAMNVGPMTRNGFDGKPTEKSAENLHGTLAAAAADRSAQANGAEPAWRHILPNTLEEIPEGMWDAVGEGVEYYRTPRAQHPNSQNKVTLTSFPIMAGFDAFAFIELIAPRPLLMIAGEKANTFAYTEGAIAKAREPKELFVIEGATHMDLYDKPHAVGPAVEKLAAFFGKHLQ